MKQEKASPFENGEKIVGTRSCEEISLNEIIQFELFVNDAEMNIWKME